MIVTGITSSWREVVSGIKERGGNANFVAGDLSTGDGVAALAEALAAADGRIDILVNNAAALVGGQVATRRHAEEMIDRSWPRTSRRRSCSPQRSRRRWSRAGGSSVNVGRSTDWSAWMVRRSTALQSSVALAHEVLGGRMRPVGRTGEHDRTRADRNRMERRPRGSTRPGIDKIPTRRMSELSKVAAVVSFLAGDDALHVYGATIAVDGGMAAAI